MPRFLKSLFHLHRAIEPRGRLPIQMETCHCGKYRMVALDRGLPWWSTEWGHAEIVSRQYAHFKREAAWLLPVRSN